VPVDNPAVTEATHPGPTPPRRPGSVRRTTNLDVTRGADTALMAVDCIAGAGRDLVTSPGGATVAGEAALTVDVGAAGTIESVRSDPPAELVALVGLRAGFGFHRVARDVLARFDGTLIGALVSDLSGAPAPSGYAAVRERILLGLADPRTRSDGGSPRIDVCAGWRAGGAALQGLAAGEDLPFVAEPPLAPELGMADADAWHPMARLGARQSRRVRRLDLWREGDALVVDAMFRDSAADPDLTVRIVHEYAMSAVVEVAGFVIRQLAVTPGSLPFPADCPAAAGSAALFVGQPLKTLRSSVGRLGRGPGSCTHLNDLLRTLADLPVLASHLP
jgi:hypothetical protein